MSQNDNDADDGSSIEERAAQTVTANEERSGSDPETVRVTLGHSGHAAGHYFEDANERKEVRFNRRVERALERGVLSRV